MNFSIERPTVLYLLVVLIPFVFYSVAKYRHFVKTMGAKKTAHVKRRFALKLSCISLSLASLIISFSGISWGTVSLPVQKNGTAVSLVFDISYSMTANDAPGGMTRLESAKSFALELLDRIPGASVSVVIAKGDGSVIVPLTDDRETVKGMISVLSPGMMTSVGTSLGSGIEATIASFPRQSQFAGHVWLFTDGDETDASLSQALTNAGRYGIPVAIIGFGSERESEVLAGDGSTKVRTALRSQALEKLVSQSHSALYVDASEMGSAYLLLRTLNSGNQESDTNVTYEIQTVERSYMFILLAILFFIASYIFSEFTLPKKGQLLLAGAATVILLTGCSERFDAGKRLLEGSVQWNRKNYPNAVAQYLIAGDIARECEDEELADYALFGLATTYLMQDESEAALRRYGAISSDAPDTIKFAVLYNSGIIAHQNGDYQKAASYFRDALRIDSTSIDAKINLELSLQSAVTQSKSQEQTLTPVSENSESEVLEQALYSVIRENEQKLWKSQQQSVQSTAADY